MPTTTFTNSITTFGTTGAKQFQTIAASVVYHITAIGAGGGNGQSAGAGAGALAGGDIFLNTGAVLEVIVGGRGHDHIGSVGGGGLMGARQGR